MLWSETITIVTYRNIKKNVFFSVENICIVEANDYNNTTRYLIRNEQFVHLLCCFHSSSPRHFHCCCCPPPPPRHFHCYCCCCFAERWSIRIGRAFAIRPWFDAIIGKQYSKRVPSLFLDSLPNSTALLTGHFFPSFYYLIYKKETVNHK